MFAIKTIRLRVWRRGASLDELLDRFKREAQVSAHRAPHIVTIYDIGDADGPPTWPWVHRRGGPGAGDRERRLPVERAAAIGAQVADA